MLALLRPLLPKWNFFNESGEAYLMQHRPAGAASDSAWQSFLAPTGRGWRCLFRNDAFNAWLAGWTLFDRFLEEAAASGQIPSHSVTAALFWGWLEREIGSSHFQFRVVDGHGEEVLRVER